MYENRHGRFTAVDPLLASGKSANPQTFNRYVYCLNNPLIFTDPTGMQVGSHYGTVHTNEMETFFSKEKFEGSHIFEGDARYVDATDEFTYNISKYGYYAIGKTAEILARGDGYSVADSLRRQEAYFNSSMPSSWVPEMMIDPPGYEAASRTVGGRFTIADGETDYRTFMRQTDEPRAFAFAVGVIGGLGGALGGSGNPPKINSEFKLSSVNWFGLRDGYGMFGTKGLQVGSYKIDALYKNPLGSGGTIFSMKQTNTGNLSIFQPQPVGNLFRLDYGLIHKTNNVGFHSTIRFTFRGNLFGSTAQRKWYPSTTEPPFFKPF